MKALIGLRSGVRSGTGPHQPRQTFAHALYVVRAAAFRGLLLTAAMMRRLIAPTVALGACLVLGACSSFSGYVADSWPTWAGGMPKDVPPRPGAPGYEEFIAHQQAKDATATTAAQSAAGAQPTTTATVPPATPVAAAPAPASAQVQPPLPPAYRRTDDQGVVQGGGLY
jgi:hypothetical protein